MSDIVERLRERAASGVNCLCGNPICEEAADEILRLRAENEKLRDGVRSTIQERDVLSGENFDLRAENEKLRAENETLAALKPFADLLATAEKIRPSHDRHLLWVETIDLRAAAAALKEMGDE